METYIVAYHCAGEFHEHSSISPVAHATLERAKETCERWRIQHGHPPIKWKLKWSLTKLAEKDQYDWHCRTKDGTYHIHRVILMLDEHRDAGLMPGWKQD